MNPLIKILLVDDLPDDVFLFQHAFKTAGVRGLVRAVADGVEALEYLQGQGPHADRSSHPFPDVVLLDINMPRLNGFEVLDWIRADPNCSRLVVHMLTSSARQADIDRAYAAHANSYVVKPTRLHDLVAFVRVLEQWHRFLALSPGPVPPSKVCATADDTITLKTTFSRTATFMRPR